MRVSGRHRSRAPHGRRALPVTYRETAGDVGGKGGPMWGARVGRPAKVASREHVQTRASSDAPGSPRRGVWASAGRLNMTPPGDRLLHHPRATAGRPSCHRCPGIQCPPEGYARPTCGTPRGTPSAPGSWPAPPGSQVNPKDDSTSVLVHCGQLATRSARQPACRSNSRVGYPVLAKAPPPALLPWT